MTVSAPSTRVHDIACWLVVFVSLALLFSPPLVNLAEALLFAVMLFSGEMRRRLAGAWRQPMTRWVLAFYAVTCIGLLYSVAPAHVATSMWGGWRKLLLLPVALALFDDPRWKQRFVLVFVSVVAVCAVISFWGWFANYLFPISDPERGILVRNHSTQGMLFAVAAFGAAVFALRSGTAFFRIAMGVCLTLLVVNIMLVTTGRSGYLVLLVCTIAMVANLLFSGGRRPSMKAMAGAGVAVLAIVAGLVLTPTSHERIAQGVHEMQDYKQEKQITSMGIRIIFWKNTLELIEKRPLFGYGTGAFETAYTKMVQGRPGLAGMPAGDPHDQYMKIIAEHGIFGLAIFIAMLFSAMYQHAAAPYRMLGLGVLAAWCASSLVNSHFSTFNEGTFIYLWLGVMLAEQRTAVASAEHG